MRLFAAALFLLAGCATTSAPPDRIEGCWIGRTPRGETTTMRWLPDSAQPGVLMGHYLSYASNEAQGQRTYKLVPGGDGEFQFCYLAAADDERCWAVARGSSGSLEGGRAFIDVHGERLRISIHDGAVERVVFQGNRDGCD
jgi:hypothetical protein